MFLVELLSCCSLCVHFQSYRLGWLNSSKYYEFLIFSEFMNERRVDNISCSSFGTNDAVLAGVTGLE